MEILVWLVGLIAAAALLLWAADVFTDHLGPLAAGLGLPMVGVAVALAGAEPEELATAAAASAQGWPDLAITDALGANLTMLTLGLGSALLVSTFSQPAFSPPGPQHVADAHLRGWALAAAGASALCAVVLVLAFRVGEGASVGRWGGLGLLVIYPMVLVGLFMAQRRGTLNSKRRVEGRAAARSSESFTLGNHAATRPGGVARSGVLVVIGLVAMMAAGALAATSADHLARGAGMSQLATGLTVLALATSAEVLALAWAARRKGLADVAVAAVLGSVLFNSTLTVGVAALAHPIPVRGPGLALVAASAALLALLVLGLPRPGVRRGLAVALPLGYVAYVVLALRM